MKLYYKRYLEYPVPIPADSIIMNEYDLQTMEWDRDHFKAALCWEAEVINRIHANQDGYFDFSKSMIDIGACLGEYCYMLPFKHQYAFEPSKESLYRMHANLVLHDHVEQCDTFQVMLSDKVEQIKFDGYHAESYSNDYWANGENESIQTTKTLDSYHFENIGFIKIDVEGMEEKVLRGSIDTIVRNNYPPILFELWDVGDNMTQEKHDSLVNFLEGLGYTIFPYWGDFETHLAVHQ